MAPKKEKRGRGEVSAAVPARNTRSSARKLRSGKSPSLPPPPPLPKRKKAKKTPVAEVKEETPVAEEEPVGRTIVIEHCKQDNSFKTKAQQVKKGLEDGVPGVNVLLNPEKPRKGCFEIREEGEGGEKFVTLLDVARPFTEVKELDIEKTIADIIEKIK